MKVVLLRVGIDSGCGGIQGPIYKDGSFELLCIPDKKGIDPRTYGIIIGSHGLAHAEYFPYRRRTAISTQSVHVDPEFETFTYGDPTPPKAGLRKLATGDLLVFYAGLEGFDCPAVPALYLVGYFEVALAGMASDFSEQQLQREFDLNFHVRHSRIFAIQKLDLVLVRGGAGSRLLTKAHLISARGRDCNGRPLKVLSPAMQHIFGDFDGRVSLQRSPRRSVDAKFVESASEFIRSLT